MQEVGFRKKQYIRIFLVLMCTICFFVAIFYQNRELDFQQARSVILFFGYFGLFDFLIIILYFATNKYGRFTKAAIILLLSSFFLFQFGQYVIYPFYDDYSYFFVNYLVQTFRSNYSIIIFSQAFTLLSMNALVFGMLCVKNYGVLKETTKRSEKNIMYKTGLLLFCISVVPALVLRIRQFSIASIYGYMGTYQYDSTNFFTKLEVFFVPSLILLIMSNKSSFTKLIFSVIAILYALICFFIGGRTVALSLLIVIFISFFKLKKRNVILLIISLYVFAVFASFIAEFRGYTNKDFSQMFIGLFMSLFNINYFFNFIGEIGFNASSLPAAINYSDGFLLGKSYLGGVISLVPNSLDFTGLVSYFSKYTLLDEWLTAKTGFGYGVGFSLVAESYINFGLFGFVLFYFAGFILGKMFIPKKQNLVSDYIILISTFFLFTSPRRFFASIMDSVLYCLIIPLIIYHFLDNSRANNISCSYLRRDYEKNS